MLKRLFSISLLLMAAVLLSSHSHAEQKMVKGDWDIHYIVVDTTFLTPEVARAYGIVRSKYNAIVNISVLDSETQEAQNVAVSGVARNLLGTSKPLSFKKVTEGDAIYYLATLSFRDQEQYRFDIEVQRGDTVEKINFQQKMYVE